MRAFFQATSDDDDIHLAAQTVGELRHWLERIRACGDAQQTGLLERWLVNVTQQYADRILDFDRECAEVCVKLTSSHPQHPIDKQIAAIALMHDLTIVTRNTPDFEGTGAGLMNPFG